MVDNLKEIIMKMFTIIFYRKRFIKPKKGNICDNRFMAEDENTDMNITKFEKVSGNNFYPGMLIREIK